MPNMAMRIAEACKPILVETARRHGTVEYGKLAQRIRSKVGLPDLDGRDPRLHDALDILSTDSYDEGQNLLLSVVVREDDRMPGPGFYYLAREVLGAYPMKTSREEIFTEKLRKAHALYGKSFIASRQRPADPTG